jgi:hypothetical protein
MGKFIDCIGAAENQSIASACHKKNTSFRSTCPGKEGLKMNDVWMLQYKLALGFFTFNHVNPLIK